jgi:hypothetical protein
LEHTGNRQWHELSHRIEPAFLRDVLGFDYSKAPDIAVSKRIGDWLKRLRWGDVEPNSWLTIIRKSL